MRWCSRLVARSQVLEGQGNGLSVPSLHRLPGHRRSPGAGRRGPTKGSWVMPPPPGRVGASSASPQKRHRRRLAAGAVARPQPGTPRPQGHACAPKPSDHTGASLRRSSSLARFAPGSRPENVNRLFHAQGSAYEASPEALQQERLVN